MAEYILPLATAQTVFSKKSPQRTSTGNFISGTVLEDDYKTAIKGVTVDVYNTNTGTPSPVKSTTSAADGTYSISGLSKGAYYVGFFPKSGSGFIIQYYSQETDLKDADEVDVSNSSGATDIDGDLSATGGISGKVSGADGKAAVENVEVDVDDKATGDNVNSTSTASDGTYSFTDLAPGTYIVDFIPPSGSKYLEQYYNNKPNSSTADAVQVTSSVVTGINAVLALGGSISGKITEKDGVTPLEDVDVTAWNYDGCNWSVMGDDTTNASGVYNIQSLATGKYLLEFDPGGKSVSLFE